MTFLSKILRRYEDSDFVLQQKARVVAITCLLLLVLMPIILGHSYYLQARIGDLDPAVLLPELSAIFLFAAAFWVLARGHYQIASHMLILIALAVFGFMYPLTRSPFGRALTVIREDEFFGKVPIYRDHLRLQLPLQLRSGEQRCCECVV